MIFVEEAAVTFPVAERFVSINGEGRKAGHPAAFIRMKGCNLSCSYCDTSWANEKNCPVMSCTLQELIDWLLDQEVKYVTLTGGEPLLVPDISLLIEAVGKAGMELEIETNGSVDITPFHLLKPRPSFTLDYKCPGSGMESFMTAVNYSLLTDKDTVKFVVSNREDLDKAFEISQQYRLAEKCQVFLSPVFLRIEPKEIVEYMISRHWNAARLQLQLHKFIWPPDQRGV